MENYMVRPYKRGGWVIVEVNTGREVILFNEKVQAENACERLNKGED
jgi:hypothetical protein